MSSPTVLPSPEVMYTQSRDLIMPEITGFFTFVLGISALFMIVKSFSRT